MEDAIRWEEPIRLVEAAYALERDDEAWLDGLLERVAAMLDQGMGVLGYVYDLSGDRPRFAAPRCVRTPEGPWARVVAGLERGATPGVLDRMRFGAAFATLTDQVAEGEISRAEYEMATALYATGGCGDSYGFNTYDPTTRTGCFVCALLPEPARTHPRDGARWTRLAAHVRAGLRLRGRLAPVDAVLDPDGRVRHAEEGARSRTARERLREAVRAVDRARAGRAGPDASVDLWKGLVSGQWSLVDQFDADGRRFVVARRNAPDITDPRALTDRERHVAAYLAQGHGDKQIAYELGLARSTISNHVRAIAAKLGVGSRVEVVALLRRLGGAAAPMELEGETLLVRGTEVEVTPGALTGAERAVADLAMAGLSNAEIARRRDVSARTIANQLAAVYRKLRVSSRAELVAATVDRPTN